METDDIWTDRVACMQSVVEMSRARRATLAKMLASKGDGKSVGRTD
jgi:hypothetical protein